MKNFLLAVAALATFAAPAFAQTPVVLQQNKMSLQGVAPQDIVAVFPTLSAVGQTKALSVVGDPGKTGLVNQVAYSMVYAPKNHTFQFITSGAPSTCTYSVYATTKLPQENPVYPADYFALRSGQSCATSTSFTANNTPVTGIIVDLTALTGGTSPTVTVRYLGGH